MDGPERIRPGTNWNEGEPEPDYLKEPRTRWRPEPKPAPQPGDKSKEKPKEGQEAPKEKSIDPGMPVPNAKTLHEKFPKLRTLILEMDKIRDKEFPMDARFDDKTFREYQDMFANMQEAMLYHAIVENWSEKALLAEYQRALQKAFHQVAERSAFHTVFEWGRSFRDWIYRKEGFSIGGDKHNKNLDNRQIKPSEKDALTRELLRLELSLIGEKAWVGEGYKWGGKDNICVEWGDGECDTYVDDGDLDSKRYKIVRDEIIPFYRDFVLDSAIVQNGSKDALLKTYPKTIAALYHSCIGGNPSEAEKSEDEKKKEKKEEKGFFRRSMNWLMKKAVDWAI